MGKNVVPSRNGKKANEQRAGVGGWGAEERIPEVTLGGTQKNTRAEPVAP